MLSDPRPAVDIDDWMRHSTISPTHTSFRYVERYQCLVLDLADGIYVLLIEELSHCFGEEGGRLG